jgi:hypothetical protein
MSTQRGNGRRGTQRGVFRCIQRDCTDITTYCIYVVLVVVSMYSQKLRELISSWQQWLPLLFIRTSSFYSTRVGSVKTTSVDTIPISPETWCVCVLSLSLTYSPNSYLFSNSFLSLNSLDSSAAQVRPARVGSNQPTLLVECLLQSVPAFDDVLFAVGLVSGFD